MTDLLRRYVRPQAPPQQIRVVGNGRLVDLLATSEEMRRLMMDDLHPLEE